MESSLSLVSEPSLITFLPLDVLRIVFEKVEECCVMKNASGYHSCTKSGTPGALIAHKWDYYVMKKFFIIWCHWVREIVLCPKQVASSKRKREYDIAEYFRTGRRVIALPAQGSNPGTDVDVFEGYWVLEYKGKFSDLVKGWVARDGKWKELERYETWESLCDDLLKRQNESEDTGFENLVTRCRFVIGDIEEDSLDRDYEFYYPVT
jgi:hypothetical protein